MSPQLPLGPVVVDLATTQLLDEEAVLLQSSQVGGLILFSRNYESRLQLQRLIADVRRVRPNILIMVDQEGGRVQRFKAEFTRLPPLQRLGECFNKDNERGLALAYDHAWVMATELLSVGVDLSLAPVLDMDSCFSEVIGDRAFSASADNVIALAGAYIRGMNDAGMAATAKHFPGHGAVKHDSHKTLPVDDRSLTEVELSDMQPFTALKSAYAAVMPAHIVFNRIDPNPVGFSPFWLQKYLRHSLGFKGVIFSDDLSMEGAAIAGDYCARADAALMAGCDAVLVCNHPLEANAVVAHLSNKNYSSQNALHTLRARDFEAARAAVVSDALHQRIKNLGELEA